MSQAKPLSFELDEEMLKLLGEEFDVQKLIAGFAGTIANKKGEEIASIGKSTFEQFGKDWMSRTLELGEKYPDKTYEVIKEYPFLRFPHVPQRFIEIAYLNTQTIYELPILETTPTRLAFEVKDCSVYKGLTERCSDEVANLMVCKHACLSALETLHQKLALPVAIEMEASTDKDGCCRFVITKLSQ